MNYWDMIDELTRLAGEETNTTSSKTLGLLKKGISFYAETLSLISIRHSTNDIVARIALASQNFNSLKLAIDAAINGYYVQSMILMRNVYENWLAFWYLAKFPTDADIWLNPQPNRRPPTAETMRNKIDYSVQETKSKLHEYYVELNRFSHTDPIAILNRLRKDEGEISVRLGVEYNPVEFDACANSILFWLANMLIAINPWVSKTDNGWTEKYESLLTEINNFHQEFLHHTQQD